MIYSPVLRLKMPGNAQKTITNVANIATFDILPMSEVFKTQFDHENYQPID
jgi:hypothetical protein